MSERRTPEPWLRGTLTDAPPVLRAVLHALELASEDLERWCGSLTDAEVNARPYGLPPVAFQIRHIARSIDRLLTYAEGQQLNHSQIDLLNAEMESGTREDLSRELRAALANAAQRIRSFAPAVLNEPRKVGRKALPTTVAGLLVHIADHTQRHVGQAVTTVKVLKAQQ